MNIAIIGAGMAGLSCAEALSGQGHRIALFDKGRGPGGRMSTRRASLGEIELRFDHGAQYFTARAPGFAQQVAAWVEQGVVAQWPAAGPDAFVGTPAMNAPIAQMAQRHGVRFGHHVAGLKRDAGQWHVHLQDGSLHGPYDAAILALPAEQAAMMLEPHHLEMSAAARASRSQPCWTAMLAFEAPLPIVSDILRADGPVVWAARNSAKPGRNGQEAWVIQAGAQWSSEHLEDKAELVADALASWLADQAGLSISPIWQTAHRWRYAKTHRSARQALWNHDLRLGACGDWLMGPRVELAWLSGQHLAKRMAEQSRPLARHA